MAGADPLLGGHILGSRGGLKRRALMRLLRIIRLRRRTEGDEMIGATVEAIVRVQLGQLESAAMNPPEACLRPEAPIEFI